MADNSLQTGTDTIRDLARQAGTVKTQVVQLDIGGSSANAEVLVTAGQQLMAASLPVVLASDYVLPTQTAAAKDNFGQALSVVAAATATIASVTAPAGYRIKGMVCHGTGEGYFAARIAGTVVLSGRIRASAPMLIITLPNGIPTATGAAVTLTVTNEAGVTADYEATLLGE